MVPVPQPMQDSTSERADDRVLVLYTGSGSLDLQAGAAIQQMRDDHSLAVGVGSFELKSACGRRLRECGRVHVKAVREDEDHSVVIGHAWADSCGRE